VFFDLFYINYFILLGRIVDNKSSNNNNTRSSLLSSLSNTSSNQQRMKRESGVGEDEMKDGENPNLEEAIVGFLLWLIWLFFSISHFLIFHQLHSHLIYLIIIIFFLISFYNLPSFYHLLFSSHSTKVFYLDIF